MHPRRRRNPRKIKPIESGNASLILPKVGESRIAFNSPNPGASKVVVLESKFNLYTFIFIMSIGVIAGLGNPGSKYRLTRHNLGFRVVDSLAESEGVSWKKESDSEAEVARIKIEGRPILLVKPNTYMNESGRSLEHLCKYYKILLESLVVVCDEVQLPLGSAKITLTGSAGGHNGIESVIEHIGDGFIRFRLGIGPKSSTDISLTDFVLGKFQPQEEDILDKNMNEYLAGLKLLVDSGPILAMNKINKKISDGEISEEQETV